MRDFDVLVIDLEGSDERLESVRHMLDREQVAWRRMPAVEYDYDEAAAFIRHDSHPDFEKVTNTELVLFITSPSVGQTL